MTIAIDISAVVTSRGQLSGKTEVDRRKNMKASKLICGLIALSTVQTITAAMNALDVQPTLGGPGSHFCDIGNNIAMLNRGGSATGFADTSAADLFSQNYWFWSGNANHAFPSEKGSLVDLGALPGTVSSASTWISSNDTIAGHSENGQIDPSVLDLTEFSAVVWLDGKIIDLGPFPGGGFESFANSVNSHGQVVGAATNLIPDPNSLWPLANSSWFVPYPYQLRAFISRL
jgi:hypothetical protein